MRFERLRPYPVLGRSGYEITYPSGIGALKEGKYGIVDEAVTGDAPKEFLGVYEFEEGHTRQGAPRRWPRYIAKVGHKHYPNESVTEQLMTRIGELLGLNMAKSRLAWAHGQLRFMSRYFLTPGRESLVHGAEIFAGFLEDRDFVETVEKEDESRHLFTFQFVEDALEKMFPEQAVEILSGFTRMLCFDALVGNNDRHFYNWGVIKDVLEHRPPCFSPIFDTARGLFWNMKEENLVGYSEKARLAKYVKQCYPKTGWEGVKQPNHFQLIGHIAKERPALRPELGSLPCDGLADRVETLLHEEFVGLFTPLRIERILQCLDSRVKLYKEAARF